MPLRSTHGEDGHVIQFQEEARDSILSQSNASARQTDMERMVSIIRPCIVTAITTIIEQIHTRGWENRTPENDSRIAKKKAKRNKDHEVRETKRKKAKTYQETNPKCGNRGKNHLGECSTNVCYRCKKPGHQISECKISSKGKCYECGSMDHLRDECPELGRDKKNLKKKFKTYQGTSPWCAKCKWHRQGKCRSNVCSKCKVFGHMAKDCNTPKTKRCYECWSANHLRNKCPELGRE